MNLPGIESLISPEQEGKSLYRIMHFDHLAEWFETGKYPLLSPEKWEDPFEKVLKESVFPSQGEVSDTNTPVFGLCLTWDGISDALWRVYSPVQYGIRIRTTPQRLAAALSVAPELKDGMTFIGEVKYRTTKALISHAQSIRDTLKESKVPEVLANTMLLKRTPFSYEREVRVLHLTQRRIAADGMLFFHADPHQIIQSILVDPRAPDYRFKALKRYFQHVAKFKGSIGKSQLYQMPSLKKK